MTDNLVTLFCLVDGDSNPFSVDVNRTKTVDMLKDSIKAKIPDTFHGADAKDFILWRVSIPVSPKKDRNGISLANVHSKEEPDETDDVSEVFQETPPKKTIHVIVTRPPPDN
ncbi:hypothetical protein BGZ83_002997, partial [Gryganskiella cystojenkinii]